MGTRGRRSLSAAALLAALAVAAPARAVAPGKAGEIAYICNPPTPAQLCAIGPDGAHRRVLFDSGPQNGSPDLPAWSPDGSRVAFIFGGIAIVRPDGSGVPSPTNVDPLSRVAWSPDGAWLAVSASPDGDPSSGVAHVFKVRLNGSGLTDLTPGVTGWAGDPEWSPDGTRVAFDLKSGGTSDIYVVGASGGTPAPLTSSPPDQPATDPSWSPDGATIAFTRTQLDVDLDPTSSTIWTVDPASGVQRALTSGSADTEPAWAPDGRALAFTRGGRALWIVAADGSGERRLAGGPSSAAMSPSWGSHPAGTTKQPVAPRSKITRLRLRPKSFWVKPDGYVLGYGPFETRVTFRLRGPARHVELRVYGCRRLRHGRCIRAGHRFLDTGWSGLRRGANHIDYDGSYRADSFLRKGAYLLAMFPLDAAGHRNGPTVRATFRVLGHCRHERPGACIKKPS